MKEIFKYKIMKRNFMHRRYFMESENSTIELVYTPYFKLECPDYPNEKGIDTEDYSFWNRVERNCKSLVNEDANILTEYIPEELKGKVTNVKLSYKEDDTLHVTCEITVPAGQIKDDLIDWVNRQMSDGWGEGFEQQELGETEVFACYDQNDNSRYAYVEFFDDEKTARNYCEDQNRDYEEDEDASEYVYDPVEVYATCSFWKKGVKNPYQILIDGYDENGYDEEGYNKSGYNSKGYDREGFNDKGLDCGGYDRKGYDAKGFDRKGFDKDGFNREGKKSLGDKGLYLNKNGKISIADPYSGIHERRIRRRARYL